MDQTYLRNRTATNKLQMLGAASKLEQAAKVIATESRKIREYLNSFPSEGMFDTSSTRNSIITTPMTEIHRQMQGLDQIFNQLAGEPK